MTHRTENRCYFSGTHTDTAYRELSLWVAALSRDIREREKKALAPEAVPTIGDPIA